MVRGVSHKTQAHQRIVAAAARAFRAQGVEQVTIANVMRDAGLTHGAFYAHFPSKDALLAEAAVSGIRESQRAFVDAAVAARPDDPIREIIRRYVSRSHRDNPGEGCAMPALTAEIAREPDEVRDAYTEAFETFIAQLMEYAPGETAEQRRDTALALAAGMAGAVALSRAVDDPKLSDRILLATRHFFTDTLSNQSEK